MGKRKEEGSMVGVRGRGRDGLEGDWGWWVLILGNRGNREEGLERREYRVEVWGRKSRGGRQRTRAGECGELGDK